MLINIAAATEERYWLAPGAWIGSASYDVRGDGAAREEPDTDSRGVPFRSVDASARCVEARSIAGGILASDSAACVLGLVGSVAIAVGGVGDTREAGFLDRAPRACVQRHLIRSLCVYAFNDVNLAICRPVGADEPEGGPDAAEAAGHVRDVGDKEAVVEGFLGGEAHA